MPTPFPASTGETRFRISRTGTELWRSFPKWFRILSIAILVCGLLGAVLAIRIAIGLREADVIKQLRQRGAKIHYPWTHMDFSPIPIPRSLIRHYVKIREQYRNIVAGLFGLSPANVQAISLEFGTDSELRLIGGHFRGLKSLTFWKSELSTDSLRSLSSCSQLEFLDLSYSDLDDAALASLKDHSRLQEMRLGATLITDASVGILEKMAALKKVDFYLTDVSSEAIARWRKNQNAPMIVNGSDELPIECGGVIRWSDGRRSANFPGPWTMTQIDDQSAETVCSNGPSQYFGRNDMSWSSLSAWTDGQWKLTLKLGECVSETVSVQMKDSQPSKRRFEFVMPCTREHAIQQVRRESKGH